MLEAGEWLRATTYVAASVIAGTAVFRRGNSSGESLVLGVLVLLQECGMTHEKFEGERTLMRIHIGESDKWHGKALHEAIVELLRKGEVLRRDSAARCRRLWVLECLSHR